MPAERPRPFGIAAAAVYREVQINRSFYLLAFALTAVPALVGLFQAGGSPSPGPILRYQLEMAAQGIGDPFGAVIAGALGIVLFARDEGQGTLAYALEGPYRRRDLWLAKAMLGAATLLAAQGVVALRLLAMANELAGSTLLGPGLVRLVAVTCAELELFAVGLALGAAMRPYFAIVFSAVGVALPALLSSFVLRLLGVQVWMVLQPASPLSASIWPERLAHALAGLSPVGPYTFGGYMEAMVVNGSTTFQPALLPAPTLLWHGAWYLVCAASASLIGLRAWRGAPAERLRDGFFYPALWNVYFAVLALFTAILAMAVSPWGQVGGWRYAAGLLASGVSGWFVWRSVLTWLGRRGLGAAP